MSFAEYATTDAVGLAALIREGEVRPEEVLQTAIERVERLNPAVNAVIRPMFEEGRSELRDASQRSPFGGVPFLLKDLLASYRGVPLASGSRFLADYVPDHDSTLVTRFRHAGLVTIGKTNTPELGLTPVTEPELFGPTRNPWNHDRTAGGSSGGSAVAVALRMVPMAGGGDGGGSIRIPASCCGVFGFKPTRGRTPIGPDRARILQGSVVEHALTWSVRDSATLLDATAGPELGAPFVLPPPARPFAEEVQTSPRTLRIAYTTEPLLGHTVDPICCQGVEETVALLRHLGHRVEEATPQIDRVRFNQAFMTMVTAEMRADLLEMEEVMGRRGRRRDFELQTWTVMRLADAVSGSQYATALRVLDQDSRAVADFFEPYDLLLTPTLAFPPIPHHSLSPAGVPRVIMEVLGRLPGGGKVLDWVGALEQAAEEVFDFIPYTPLFNVTGQPAMSVPLCWSPDGLPIGMHFVGRYGDEATLFQLAGQLEREAPWADRRPPGPSQL